MPIRATGAACLAALMLISGCKEKTGAGEQAAAPAQTGGSEVTARDEEREAQPAPSLPDARSMGISGWQETSYLGRGSRTALDDNALSPGAGALRALADARPELSVIPDEDGRPYLTGLVEPGDTDAIMGVFGSANVRADGMASAPPNSEIRSLGAMAAAAIQLMSVEPSATALVGGSARPEVASRLERAAGAWPSDARVWRIIGMPPDSHDGASVRFMPDNDPEDDHDETRHRRLQAMGILEFAPIEGGGPGDLITASVGFPFQNQEQHDRELRMRFLYDRGTSQWALYSVVSSPSRATIMGLAKAGEMDRLESMMHSMDLLSVLPDCHLVVGPDGPLLCK